MYKSTRNPFYKVWVDFGAEIGEKQTSAQITQHYTPQQLVGKKVIGCLNLRTKNIAEFLSEFLPLGFADSNGAICLASADPLTLNGKKLH